MKLTCSRIGCKNSATKWPKLSFAAEAMPDGPRATFDFPLPVCDAHASTDPAVSWAMKAGRRLKPAWPRKARRSQGAKRCAWTSRRSSDAAA